MIDPDSVLRHKIVEFVSRGDFGLASGQKNGGYERIWYDELIAPEEVVFEPGVFLLKKNKAQVLKVNAIASPTPDSLTVTPPSSDNQGHQGAFEGFESDSPTPVLPQTSTLRLTGTIPPELWNRLGTKLIPKLRSGDDLVARVEFSLNVSSQQAQSLEIELRQILDDLGLNNVQIERQEA